jgi:general secretion pathway protein M
MPELWPPDAPRGSAFLEGDTMTVAGAALLQRVTSAVGRTGGYVVSSQIELQSSTSGRIGLVITGEMNPAALQGFLYDIEGGMPFLFVDQLLVQAPGGSEATEGGNARMTITLSGQWRRER